MYCTFGLCFPCLIQQLALIPCFIIYMLTLIPVQRSSSRETLYFIYWFRFNYLFATKRSTHLEMIKKMIRDGLYTVQMDDMFPADANESPFQYCKFSRRGKPHLIAKNVIDEAKKTLLDHCGKLQLVWILPWKLLMCYRTVISLR